MPLQNSPQSTPPSITARVLAAVAVVVLCILVWWIVELRTTPPPPPAKAVTDPAYPAGR